MQVDVQIVSAFIDGDSGGNPAGVVLDADALSPAQKLAVAKQVDLSETAFVSHSDTAAFKLDFFTPTRQIAHCGHATIATFSLLRQLGRVSDGLTSKETIDGKRDILIQGEMAFMEQRAPQYSPLAIGSDIYRRVLDSLDISAAQLLDERPPCVVNTGNDFLITPLRDAATLARLEPDFLAIEELSDQLDLIGYYAFACETKRPGRVAGARMFAPRYGIKEEAATGMAAGPLACYLRDRLGLQQTNMQIEQGQLMPTPSPSVITVELVIGADGKIQKLMAGGRAKSVRTISVTV
jgi:PhzF family phenazine biosynthesis protein